MKGESEAYVTFSSKAKAYERRGGAPAVGGGEGGAPKGSAGADTCHLSPDTRRPTPGLRPNPDSGDRPNTAN